MKYLIKINLSMLLSTWFFTGYFPFASGTLGTITAIPLCFLFSQINVHLSLSLIILLSFFPMLVSKIFEEYEKIKDSKKIVVDEVIGMSYAMVGVTFTKENLFFCFFLFRLIDILKPQPIKYVDKNIQKGFGIVLDDIFSGIITNLSIRFISLYFLE